MIQISSLKTTFGNYKKDISDVSNTLFLDWCQNISDFIYERVVSSNPDRYFTTYTFTRASGATSAALPSDFRDMGHFGAGLFTIDSQGNTSDSLTYTGYGASGYGYYISDGYIYFTQPPQQSTTYILRYIPLPPVFTAVSEYFSLDKTSTGKPIVRDEDREYLVRAIDVQYTMWDEDLGMESVADARFVRILSDMLRRQRMSPNVYNLESNNSAF